MQVLAIEREIGPVDWSQQGEVLRAEAARVWELKKAGVIRDVWFTARDRTAIVMLECASEAEAQAQLATLPLVAHGLIGFDVMALTPYDGLDRLLR